MSDEIKVLLVDDRCGARMELKLVLQKSRTLTVVGEAASSEEAIAKASAVQPTVIVCATDHSRRKGIETALHLKKRFTTSKILVLTKREDDNCIFAKFGSGVDGYCLSDASANQILSAVHAVAVGACWLDPCLAKQTISYKLGRRKSGSGFDLDSFALSTREIEVLQSIVEGLSNNQIAEKLHLSCMTIKVHCRTLYSKLMVSDRTQAAVKALREGLVS